MTLVPYGPLGQDKTGQSLTFFKISSYLLPYIIKKKYIHIYKYLEALYQDCKFHVLRGREFCSNAGPKWPHTGSDNAYNVKKYYPPLPHICKIN